MKMHFQKYQIQNQDIFVKLKPCFDHIKVFLHLFYSGFDIYVSARSPLYTHISATLNGITTIRAFGLKDKILGEFFTCLDYQVEAYLTYLLCSRWFGFRLDCLALVFQSFAFFAPVVAAEFIGKS